MTCFRDPDRDPATPCLKVTQVAAGQLHACAVDDVGGVTCWGSNADGQTTAPQGLATVVHIAAGGAHTCAADGAGRVACWGSNTGGQTTVPDGLGNIVQVAAGTAHSCALDDAGRITCWGDDTYLQSRVPADLGTVMELVAGARHTCAIDDTGLLTCWGSNSSDQATVPAALGTVVAVTAGDHHTCAIDTTGLLTCWGYSSWGEATAARSGAPTEPLEVRLSLREKLRKGEPAELGVSVTRRGQPLSFEQVSYRVLMEPGRLRWQDGKLLFWSDEVGPASIAIDVFAPPKSYGQGATKVIVGD